MIKEVEYHQRRGIRTTEKQSEKMQNTRQTLKKKHEKHNKTRHQNTMHLYCNRPTLNLMLNLSSLSIKVINIDVHLVERDCMKSKVNKVQSSYLYLALRPFLLSF